MLTLDDYRSVCDDYEFKLITQNDDIRLTAEAAAMEQIASYLRHRYDTDRAFAAVGPDRNSMLVQCAVNIALWLMIHERGGAESAERCRLSHTLYLGR